MNKLTDFTTKDFVPVLVKLLGCQEANKLVTPDIIVNQTITKQKINKAGAEQLLKDLASKGLIAWSNGIIIDMSTGEKTVPGYYTTREFANFK